MPNVYNNLPLNVFYTLISSYNVNTIRNIAMYVYFALKEREVLFTFHICIKSQKAYNNDTAKHK